MCGIAGVLGNCNPTVREALVRMSGALSHRGPDHAAFWNSRPDRSGNLCMFAHRRLSILDLSAAADQPMTYAFAGGEHTLIFNGEIYNFKDLRDDLEARGERFESSGDTAVMLRLLALDGPDAVAKLRGMFAFALWDNSASRLILARDPLGIKPLYVAHNQERPGAWSMMFASELRAILASGLIERPRLDPRALASVVWNGFVAGPNTAVSGIESLEPGELRVIDATGARDRARTFWHIPRPVAIASNEEALGDVLASSVKAHLISDVPLGIFLSSGIDSSAVANLAQKNSASPVHTFTLCFEESQFNEGHYARRIAAAIGTHHHEITLTEQQFASAADDAIDTLDQPTFDGLNSYFISKAVREAGLKVALLGTGGDELFGGYSSFRAVPELMRWARYTKHIPPSLKNAVARLASQWLAPRPLGGTPPQVRWAKLPDMVAAGAHLIDLYQLSYALFLPEYQNRLVVDRDILNQTVSGLPRALESRLSAEIAGRSPLAAISALEQRVFLGERLLRDTDAASMAVSLETRLPLVDCVVVEAANGVADDQRYQPIGRKAILRRVGLKGIDPGLFERPKVGFVLPFDRWIRRSLGGAMNETMRDASLARSVGLDGTLVGQVWSAFQDGKPGLYWSRVWALYILIRWCHRHGVLL